MAWTSSTKQKPIQRETQQPKQQGPNLTGIPTQMKLDFERRSQLSFDDVRVHYHSDQPAKLGALAYTRGTQVYIGPGAERHLRHELGHVVQQKHRKIRPDVQISGLPVNNSQNLEGEANQFASGPIPPQSLAANSSQACIQRMKLPGGQSGNWVDVVKALPAEQKIRVRKAFIEAAGKTTTYEIPGIGTLEPDDMRTKPSSIYDFYEKITDHMSDSIYWIEYESFATGDLSSLAAAVINNPRHGLSMKWREIGVQSPEANMRLLAQFLGGVVDQDGETYFVVTDEGAKGQWAPVAPAKCYNDLNVSERVTVDLENAAFSYLISAREWMLHKNLLSDIASDGSRLAQCIATLFYNSDHRQINEVIRLQQKILAEMRFILSHAEQEKFAASCQRLQEISFDGANIDILPRIASIIRENADLFQNLIFAHLHPASSQEEGSSDGDSRSHKPTSLKYTDGTKLIAIHWNEATRNKTRLAWTIDEKESTGNDRSYDTKIENWLKEIGIDPDQAVKGKDIVVLWIRKSGERGGAHYEQDTSFQHLHDRALQYQENGKIVFLAGDDKGKKAESVAKANAENIYNITEFWKQGSHSLQAWNGHTRMGQLRLYDYLKRHAKSLQHIGARSGNLEAMALMGHKVQIRAFSKQEDGVKRMLAYQTHDLSQDEGNKISYDFTYIKGYDKNTATDFIYLKHNAIRILDGLKRDKNNSLFGKENKNRLFAFSPQIRAIVIKGLIDEVNFDSLQLELARKFYPKKTFKNQVMIVTSKYKSKQQMDANQKKDPIQSKADFIHELGSAFIPSITKTKTSIDEFKTLYPIWQACFATTVQEICDSHLSSPDRSTEADSGNGNMGKSEEQLLDAMFIRAAKLKQRRRKTPGQQVSLSLYPTTSGGIIPTIPQRRI